MPLVLEQRLAEASGLVPSTSLDFNDNEDIPTELSDSSETHDEGTVSIFRPLTDLLHIYCILLETGSSVMPLSFGNTVTI